MQLEKKQDGSKESKWLLLRRPQTHKSEWRWKIVEGCALVVEIERRPSATTEAPEGLSQGYVRRGPFQLLPKNKPFQKFSSNAVSVFGTSRVVERLLMLTVFCTFLSCCETLSAHIL